MTYSPYNRGPMKTSSVSIKKTRSDSLEIDNLHVSVDGKEILKGIDLIIKSGEVHAIMGPNGSGKSTLAYSLMGHPAYKVQSHIKIGEKDISTLSTQERAKAGLFLALQSPIAIPGVSVVNLLRTAYQELYGNIADSSLSKDVSVTFNPVLTRRWNAGSMSLPDFMRRLKQYTKILHIDESFLTRGIHDGFSGGEKKKVEMLQALVLHPKFAIFDEIDTGLDVDALRTVAKGIEELVKQGAGVLVITHYQRILKYMHTDRVHIFVDGKIVRSGSSSLAHEIEEKGYKEYL